jgi:hypothetical protein
LGILVMKVAILEVSPSLADSLVFPIRATLGVEVDIWRS